MQDQSIKPRTKQEAHEFLMNLPHYQKQQRLVRKANYEEAIRLYADCCQSAELLSESSGQFTGGFYTETYLYADHEHEFSFQEGKMINLEIYRREES